MSVDAILSALAAYWTECGVEPNPGATDAEIDAHEVHYGITLPDELRAYFRTVNGMAEGSDARAGWDQDLIRFYPLADCRPLDVEWPDSETPDAGSILCFADYSIWGWGYGVRVRGGDAGAVHVLYNPETVKAADSFGAFLTSYLRRDDAVTFPL